MHIGNKWGLLRMAKAKPPTKKRGAFGPKQGATAKDAEVGRRVRALRLERHMSQSTLGKHLGVTFQQIQKYERGANRIGAGRLHAISEIFGAPVSAFFAEKKQSVLPTLYDLAHSRGAVALLCAYDSIPDPKLKRTLVQLATAMASLAASVKGK